jgi:vesicle transport protein SEC22
LDTRTQRNLAKLNDELYEVHQIMTRNVQEVLGVGEKLDREFHTVIVCSLYCIAASLYLSRLIDM